MKNELFGDARYLSRNARTKLVFICRKWSNKLELEMILHTTPIFKTAWANGFAIVFRNVIVNSRLRFWKRLPAQRRRWQQRISRTDTWLSRTNLVTTNEHKYCYSEKEKAQFVLLLPHRMVLCRNVSQLMTHANSNESTAIPATGRHVWLIGLNPSLGQL